MKASRDTLIECGAGQQITSNLFDRKLIEWHVLIERTDDPVAKEP